MTRSGLTRNSTFLSQVVIEYKTEHNISRLQPHDFEFRNGLKNLKVGQARFQYVRPILALPIRLSRFLASSLDCCITSSSFALQTLLK
jgi:hypothetical protein